MLLGENISLKMTWAYSWWMDTRSFPVSLDYVECTWGTSTKEIESGGQMSVILRTTADLWHIRLVVYESFKSHLLPLFKKKKAALVSSSLERWVPVSYDEMPAWNKHLEKQFYLVMLGTSTDANSTRRSSAPSPEGQLPHLALQW